MTLLHTRYASGNELHAGAIVAGSVIGLSGMNDITTRINSVINDDSVISGGTINVFASNIQAGSAQTDASGDLTINFSTTFAARPVVTVSAEDSNVIATTTTISTTQVVVKTRIPSGGTTGAGSSHSHGAGTYDVDSHDHSFSMSDTSSGPSSTDQFVDDDTIILGCCSGGGSVTEVAGYATGATGTHTHSVSDSGNTGNASPDVGGTSSSESSHTHSFGAGTANSANKWVHWIAIGET
jgi:hypothetical protein